MQAGTEEPADDAEEAPGRRERKKQATRQALHDAAMDLAEERGLAHVTVEAITERADVAVRTFFNYFNSKEEAILQPEPGRAERVCQAIAARPPDESPLETLRWVALHDLRPQTLDSAGLLRRMRLVATEPNLLAVMASAFEELHNGAATEIARRTGVERAADAYPDLIVAVAFTAFKISMLRWCAAGGTGDLATVIDTAFATLASGLTCPAATPAPSPQPRPSQEATRP